MTDLSQLTEEKRAALIEALERHGFISLLLHANVKEPLLDAGLIYFDYEDETREVVRCVRLTPAGRLLAQALKEIKDRDICREIIRSVPAVNELEQLRARVKELESELEYAQQFNWIDSAGGVARSGQFEQRDPERRPKYESEWTPSSVQAPERCEFEANWVRVVCTEDHGDVVMMDYRVMEDELPDGPVRVSIAPLTTVKESAQSEDVPPVDDSAEDEEAPRQVWITRSANVHNGWSVRRHAFHGSHVLAECRRKQDAEELRDAVNTSLESAQAPDRWVPAAECGELGDGEYICLNRKGGFTMGPMIREGGKWAATRANFGRDPEFILCRADGSPITIPGAS